MQRLGRDLPKFEALGTQVLGISYDDATTQHKFAIHCAAEFPFLSDQGGKVAAQYHSNGGFGPIQLAKRRTFIIDRAGIVRFIYDGMPDNPKILSDLKTLGGQEPLPAS